MLVSTTGNVSLSITGNATLTSVQSGAALSAQASGNASLGSITASGAASFNVTGAITDGTGVVSGGQVALSGATGVGTSVSAIKLSTPAVAASSATGGAPGHLVRSVFTDRHGMPILGAGAYRVDHSSPFKERWGGWYVTGTHGKQAHMGNWAVENKRDPAAEGNEQGQNVTDLKSRFTVASYLTPHSDLVALMVYEHQTEAHNRIARALISTRQALHYQDTLNKELKEPADHRWESVARRIESAGDQLAKYLLFSGEAKLEGAVSDTSDFAKQFPGFDWAAWAKAQGYEKRPEVVVAQPSYFKGVGALAQRMPLDSWKAWLSARVITAEARLLSKAFVDANFEFFGTVLNGQQAQRPPMASDAELRKGIRDILAADHGARPQPLSASGVLHGQDRSRHNFRGRGGSASARAAVGRTMGKVDL